MQTETQGAGLPAVEEESRAELHRSPQWYACRTRARAEKRVGLHLRGRGVPTFVPLIARVRQWADRKKRVEFPLFPGYVFAHFQLSKMHEVLSAPGVATIVRHDGQPAPVREDELQSVRIFVAGVNAGRREPQPVEYFETGQQVIVRDGPFAGMRGVLLNAGNGARVAVHLTALRQAVSVELPRELLRRAED